jgi:hypothetical protein
LYQTRPHARLWRRLAAGLLAIALLAAYWMVLQAVDARFYGSHDEPLAPAPPAMLDRHTPRVD